MKEPLVSVICTAYNHEPFIRKCLNGFIIQKTNFPFEVLINEDASSDKTASIIKEYEIKYPEIVKPIYQIENQYSKRVGLWSNILFPLAKGKYLSFCEGDDYWTDPFKLQKQVDFLEKNPEFFASSHGYNETYTGLKGFCPIISKNKTEFGVNDFIFKIPIHTSTILTRATFIHNSIKLPRNIFSGDKALYFLMASMGKIGYIPEVMSNHLIHGDGVSQNRTQVIINKDFKILPWILEINPSFPKHAFLASIYRSKFLLKKNTPYFERLKYFYWFSFHLFKDSPKNIKTFLHTLIWLNNKNLFLRVLDFIFQNNFQRRQKLLDRLK